MTSFVNNTITTTIIVIAIVNLFTSVINTNIMLIFIVTTVTFLVIIYSIPITILHTDTIIITIAVIVIIDFGAVDNTMCSKYTTCSNTPRVLITPFSNGKNP